MRALGAAFGLVGLLLVVGVIGYLVAGAPRGSGGTGTGVGDKPARPGYVGGLLDAKDNVQVQAALVSVRRRVSAYPAAHGAFPATLDAMAAQEGIPLPDLPAGVTWKYSPATGEVDIE